MAARRPGRGLVEDDSGERAELLDVPVDDEGRHEGLPLRLEVVFDFFLGPDERHVFDQPRGHGSRRLGPLAREEEVLNSGGLGLFRQLGVLRQRRVPKLQTEFHGESFLARSLPLAMEAALRDDVIHRGSVSHALGAACRRELARRGGATVRLGCVTEGTGKIEEIGRGEAGRVWLAMRELRPHLPSAEAFTSQVDELQRPLGYRLVGVFPDGAEQAAAVAGFRLNHNLVSGKHIYIDDLSTLPEHRGTRRSCSRGWTMRRNASAAAGWSSTRAHSPRARPRTGSTSSTSTPSRPSISGKSCERARGTKPGAPRQAQSQGALMGPAAVGLR